VSRIPRNTPDREATRWTGLRPAPGGDSAGPGQVWLATRRGAAAEAFSYEEIVRLARGDGVRAAFQPTKPQSKQEKIAAQYVSRLLMNEVASDAVVIGEGPHDRETLNGPAGKRYSKWSTAGNPGAVTCELRRAPLPSYPRCNSASICPRPRLLLSPLASGYTRPMMAPSSSPASSSLLAT